MMLSRDTDLYLKGMRLNPDDVEMLEQSLVESPDNIKMRIQLLAYFASRIRNQQAEEISQQERAEYIKHHARHSLRVVGHHPLDKISRRPWAIIDHNNSPDDHERARTLWLAHLMSSEPQGDLLLNVLAFMRQTEPDVATALADQIRKLPDADSFLSDLESLLSAEPE